MTRHIELSLDARLADQQERLLSVQVPLPLSDRIDALVDQLEESGAGRVARKELVAALLLDSPIEPKKLERALRRYRKARVRDAVVEREPDGDVVRLTLHRPGPRQRVLS